VTAYFDIRAKLMAGLEEHRAGRLAAAAAAYRAVLIVDPGEANALQLLGVIARAQGAGINALLFIGRAAVVAPDLDGVKTNLENAVFSAVTELGKLEDRMATVDRTAAILTTLAGLAPKAPAILRSLGAAQLIQGREDEARRSLQEADAAVDGAPAPSGLSLALDGLAQQRRDYGFAGTVVIPAYNAADYLPKALDSIAASVAFARANGGGEDFKVHVAVVNDCSPDNGVDVVCAWMKDHPGQSVTLLHNNQNRGAGASRNLGAAVAYGPYLWFLDADDHLLENHLLLTKRCLDERPYIGYVRTGIEFDKIDDQISDEWRSASEFTYPCNMAVRRECHDYIGGFPVEKPFGSAGPEDVAYSRSLWGSFTGAKTKVKTVFYTMRPGNILEKLYREMMSEGKKPDEAEQGDPRFSAVEILIRRKLYALDVKRSMPWDGPQRTPPDRKPRLALF
jgi:tetratricopeptide (TPR) repeat protein